MVQSVELLLSEDLDVAVRAEWRRLTAARLPSQGRISAESNRPHVTLGVATAIPDAVEDALAREIPSAPLPVRLGGVIVFGGRRLTLARLVVPTPELLALQHLVHDLIADCDGVPSHIVPGEWTPHVTLARRIPAPDLGTAVSVTRAAAGDVTGVSDGVRRWDSEHKREWRIGGPG
ncbi:2'-5' RNA ligase family protein [Prescottella subtropica]|uniref:2'-5' RNA ligase family protein n=1 Tax=Prescottella subtropica TaxID=2545757 RepID=UPI0010F9419C|nr:2'-5' RNA ligase family protein [Prescottella subtropica]